VPPPRRAGPRETESSQEGRGNLMTAAISKDVKDMTFEDFCRSVFDTTKRYDKPETLKGSRAAPPAVRRAVPLSAVPLDAGQGDGTGLLPRERERVLHVARLPQARSDPDHEASGRQVRRLRRELLGGHVRPVGDRRAAAYADQPPSRLPVDGRLRRLGPGAQPRLLRHPRPGPGRLLLDHRVAQGVRRDALQADHLDHGLLGRGGFWGPHPSAPPPAPP